MIYLNAKNILIILLAIIILVFFFVFFHLNSNKYDESIYEVETVSFLPEGFVPLDTVITDSDGRLLEYVFWETQISFLDEEGKAIYQSNVKNDDFIVEYNGEYYINKNEFPNIRTGLWTP